MIQTGDLEFHDYGAGFIDIEIYLLDGHDGIFVRLWFATIDDGDLGSWTKMKSKKKAKELIDKVANEVFKDMIQFPTMKVLNEKLQKYKIKVEYE